MRISSFDIFDTCLLRKCGTVDSFYDVLSTMAFNGEVTDQIARDFAFARKKAEDKLWNENPNLRLHDIYEGLPFSHTLLKSAVELEEIELTLEREMLTSSIEARALVDKCRSQGFRIVFISDMYLPDNFIREELSSFGFFKEGDGLYISSTCGCTKQSGELFQYARRQENVPFRKWHHYGDSLTNDVVMPSSLGIKSTRFVNEYSPYQRSWLVNDFSGQFDYPSMLAGVSRYFSHSTYSENGRYCDFVVDLIAPLYCSFVYSVLKGAYDKGVRTLYFCARDAFQIFHVAEQMTGLFKGMNIEYLFMSRDSLYSGDAEARLVYFKQVGLARKDGTAAIVDITTSGKTIIELNRFLSENGYSKVRGFFFLLWDDLRNFPVDREMCFFELEAREVRRRMVGRYLLDHLYVFENFFALNAQPRTVDYQCENELALPVFDDRLTEIETELTDGKESVSRYFTSLLAAYAKEYVSSGLGRYSKEILHGLAIPTLSSFFSIPDLHYISALEHYRVYSDRTGKHVPYVLRSPEVLLKLKSADSFWWTASALWSLPCFLRPLYRRRLYHIVKFD